MMGPSKILTVSYGTFSCTLEGFDEPFSTMRGIAEYFRDLAADDRYFGAEPPTPDAEMLHRIAQRDVHSRVEAQIEDNGVTLRQVEEDVAEEEPEPQAQAIEEPAPVAPVAAPVVAAATVAAVQTVVDDPVDVTPLNEAAPVETESVAAKLARIRAVVSSDGEEEAEYVEDTQSESMFDSSPISAAFDAEFEDDVQEEIVQEFAETEDFSQDEPVEEEVLEAEADETPEEIEEPEVEEPEVDEIAAEEQGHEPEASVEDEVEEASEEEVEYVAEAVEEVEELADENDDVSEEAEAEELTAEAEEAEESSDTEDDLSDDADDTGDSISRIMGAVSTDEVEIDVEDEDAMDDPDQPAIARVVKMRREDFEAALETGDLEEISEGDDVVEATSEEADETAEVAVLDENGEETSLSEEDEAELMANLEQVQRKADADVRAEKEGRALMENKDIEHDPDSVSRILDVTNTELEETEGTRRRSAIAHLKAAVAATRADKFFTKQREEEDENELNQYRDDLEKVVKPRRPAAEAGAKSRRVAPLVLVTEQRVDAPAEEPAAEGAIVRPRRVISGNLALSDDDDIEIHEETGENIFAPDQSFAEFANDMGAVELIDQLEAAAAYSAYVESEEHFSRPQIMKAVAALNEEEFTREEGLRSFGLLLRRGKIKKLKRGQFVIADTTRFNPEIRAVGE